MVTREFFYKPWFWFKSLQSLFAKVQTKIRKGKGGEKRKGPRGQNSAATKKRPTAQLPLPPEPVRSSFLFSLTYGPTYQATPASSTSVQNFRLGTAQSSRLNPHDLVSISYPPRAYKTPSLSHASPSQNPSESAVRLLAIRAAAP
jgi:hypothetical protein